MVDEHKADREATLPDDEAGEHAPKPIDERNQDQGKLQQTFPAQERERGTRDGNSLPPED